jgi:hypothetical protein
MCAPDVFGRAFFVGDGDMGSSPQYTPEGAGLI